MIIDLKHMLTTLLIVLCAYTLYSISLELYLAVFLNIAMVVRIVHHKFYIYHIWSEYSLLGLKILLFTFFHFRGFLGSNTIYFVAYYLIQILFIISIVESSYYIYKTINIRKEHMDKIIKDDTTFDVSKNEISNANHELETNFEFGKRRLDRHNVNDEIDISSTKPEVIDFHGMKVKVLSEEQKQNFLKKVKK